MHCGSAYPCVDLGQASSDLDVRGEVLYFKHHSTTSEVESNQLELMSKKIVVCGGSGFLGMNTHAIRL